jgi:HAD superfamily hydrolase (TIGR01509 family)
LIGADGKKLAMEVASSGGRQLDDEEAGVIDRRSGQLYDALNTRPRPVPGARDLLLALAASSLPWAIATSSLPDQVRASVASLGLPELPRIVDGSHVVHAKPAPDLLLLAAEQLDVKPEQCWYVGDATWDMLASMAAGMVAVGVAYGAALEPELLNAGAQVVTSFDDLAADLQRRGLIAP